MSTRYHPSLSMGHNCGLTGSLIKTFFVSARGLLLLLTTGRTEGVIYLSRYNDYWNRNGSLTGCRPWGNIVVSARMEPFGGI